MSDASAPWVAEGSGASMERNERTASEIKTSGIERRSDITINQKKRPSHQGDGSLDETREAVGVRRRMVVGVLLCSGLLPDSPAQGQTSASTTTETCSAGEGHTPGVGRGMRGLYGVRGQSGGGRQRNDSLILSIQDTGNMNVGGR